MAALEPTNETELVVAEDGSIPSLSWHRTDCDRALTSAPGWVASRFRSTEGPSVFFHPSEKIEVTNASTGATISSISGFPDGTPDVDPKLFSFGPIDAVPWTPLTFTVADEPPTVDGWSVHGVPHNGPRNACSS